MNRERTPSIGPERTLTAMAGRQSLRLSLKANLSWAFVGNVAYALSQWGMLVVLAKLGSEEMVGRFALGLAVTAPVMGFANLQLRLVHATDARGDYLFEHYLGLQVVGSALAVLLTAGAKWGQGYPGEAMWVILVLALAKGIENVSDVFFGLFQKHDRMDLIGRSLMIKGSLSLLALGTIVWLAHSLFWGVLGLFATWTLVFLLYDVRNRALLMGSESQSRGNRSYWPRPRFEARALARLAWLALPLGFSTMLVALNTSIPRYFVEKHLGERELGIFAALAYFHRAGTTFANALGEAASPRLSRHYAAHDMPGFSALLLKMTGVAVLIGVAAMLVAHLAGRPILTLFYGPAYARQSVFVRVMAASSLSYVASFLLYGLTAARCLSVQTLLYILTAAMVGLACIALVPAYGLEGAADALLIARGVQVIGALAATLWVLAAQRGPARERREQ